MKRVMVFILLVEREICVEGGFGFFDQSKRGLALKLDIRFVVHYFCGVWIHSVLPLISKDNHDSYKESESSLS